MQHTAGVLLSAKVDPYGIKTQSIENFFQIRLVRQDDTSKRNLGVNEK